MNKEGRSNIGLPKKIIPSMGTQRFQTGQSKVNSGINAVTKATKGQAHENAKRGLGQMQKTLSLETDTKDVKKSLGITESAIALIEQLLEESKVLLEERNNTTKIGSAPEAGGRVYQEPRVRYDVNALNRNMRNVTEAKQKQQRQLIDDASKIQPGTEMTARENVIGITQGATNKYSAGKLLGAQNRARYLDMKEKEMQQEQGDDKQEKGQ
jgi:hypothetical protein